jgi:predicted Zn-ribbon and HTH transcriptional regulator
MDRMKFETPDGASANIAKLAELFPAAVSEGKVNFDILRTILGDEVFGDEAHVVRAEHEREGDLNMDKKNNKKVRVYLDNCCFNRPYDDQSQTRIEIEAKAKMFIQKHIAEGNIELVWSYILDFENGNNPFLEKRNAIAAWKSLAIAYVDETEDVIQSAERIAESGVKESDSLHVAAAIAGNCGYFITTDDRIKCPDIPVKIVNPMEFVKDWSDNRDN